MQTKTSTIYHCTSNRMSKIKRMPTSSVDQNTEQLELLCTADGDEMCATILGKIYSTCMIVRPNHSSPRFILKKNAYLYEPIDMYEIFMVPLFVIAKNLNS